jgi:RNA polymerase sigma factor (sigma-70 family)
MDRSGARAAGPRESSGDRALDQDRPLVARARKGDRAAFTRLVERHHRRIFRVAYRMLGDAEAAADATQETFLSAWQHLGGFEERSRFSTWLVRIVMNRCRNVRRAAATQKAEPLPIDPPGDPERGPEAEAGRREMARRIECALGEIHPEHREILVLREIEGLGYDALAAILDVEEGTVKSRLHRARAALREKLRGVWPP